MPKEGNHRNEEAAYSLQKNENTMKHPHLERYMKLMISKFNNFTKLTKIKAFILS